MGGENGPPRSNLRYILDKYVITFLSLIPARDDARNIRSLDSEEGLWKKKKEILIIKLAETTGKDKKASWLCQQILASLRQK